MARGPEGKIQDAVVKYAKSKGCAAKKNEVGRYFVQSGWKDYIIFGKARARPGIVHLAPWAILMEFKRPGGQLTALQAARERELNELWGGPQYTVDSIEQGKRIIDKEFA